LPGQALGALYPVTATITSWTGTNARSGTDTTSATITIDNLAPSVITAGSIVQGSTRVTLNYTTPSDVDISSVVVLVSTSTITDIPVEGVVYTAGNTVGASTVGCVDNQVIASGMSLCAVTGLTNGTTYHFKIFTKDSYGNYSAGSVPSGSPATPNVLMTSVKVASFRLRNDNGDDSSATYSASENTGNSSSFIQGDKVRARFVISNEAATTTTKSYQAEYATGVCTSWTSVPRRIDATYQAWRIDPSLYVADNTVTSHSNGMSVPPGKTFTPGRVQTFNKMTQPITLQSGEYTEVEFLLRSTNNLVPDASYCFRVTNSGEASDFTYTQIPQIVPMSRVFRYQGGGGGGGYRVVEIEHASIVATTTVTGGAASSTQATSTQGEIYIPAATSTATTTPNKGSGGDGDVGVLPTLNSFAYNKNVGEGLVLGAESMAMCTNMKSRMLFGVNDTTTEGEVSQLQYYLKGRGYFNGSITGDYFSQTKKAVEEFQKDNGLIVTGIVGKVTRGKMREVGCLR
jgi:hypothetical protein